MDKNRRFSQWNRRDLMLAGGAGAVLMGMPFRAARAAAAPVSPIMTKLSAYMAEAANKALPDAVQEKTKQMILDALSAMISGSELPPGKFAINFARAYKGEKISTVAASDVVCGPIEAALANGMLAHSDETDDTHPSVMATAPGSSARRIAGSNHSPVWISVTAANRYSPASRFRIVNRPSVAGHAACTRRDPGVQ